MFHPTRGGTRGGQGDFKWSDVAADKDREYYLGHSLRAPVGRWQNGKDLTWYNKEGGADAEARERERQEELKRIKEAEEDALAQALGFAPTPRQPTVPATPSVSTSTSSDPNAAILEKARRKAEKRAEHEARKAERQRIREERAARHKHGRDEREGSARSAGGSDHERRRERERTRSRSPRRRTDYHDRDERDHHHRPARSRYEDLDPLGRSHANRQDAYGVERRVRGGSAERDDADRHGSRRHRDDVRRDERYRSRESEERRVSESGPSSRPLPRDEERYAGARHGAEMHAASKREESSRSPPPSPRRRL